MPRCFLSSSAACTAFLGSSSLVTSPRRAWTVALGEAAQGVAGRRVEGTVEPREGKATLARCSCARPSARGAGWDLSSKCLKYVQEDLRDQHVLLDSRAACTASGRRLASTTFAARRHLRSEANGPSRRCGGGGAPNERRASKQHRPAPAPTTSTRRRPSKHSTQHTQQSSLLLLQTGTPRPLADDRRHHAAPVPPARRRAMPLLPIPHPSLPPSTPSYPQAYSSILLRSRRALARGQGGGGGLVIMVANDLDGVCAARCVELPRAKQAARAR